jgi:hypothetical protein
MIGAREDIRDGSRNSDHAQSTHDFGKDTTRHHGRRQVVKSKIESCRTTVSEPNCAFGFGRRTAAFNSARRHHETGDSVPCIFRDEDHVRCSMERPDTIRIPSTVCRCPNVAITRRASSRGVDISLRTPTESSSNQHVPRSQSLGQGFARGRYNCHRRALLPMAKAREPTARPRASFIISEEAPRVQEDRQRLGRGFRPKSA